MVTLKQIKDRKTPVDRPPTRGTEYIVWVPVTGARKWQVRVEVEVGIYNLNSE